MSKFIKIHDRSGREKCLNISGIFSVYKDSIMEQDSDGHMVSNECCCIELTGYRGVIKVLEDYDLLVAQLDV